MPDFAATDVWDVARAMLATAIDNDVSCGMNAYNLCRHCNGSINWDKPHDDIVHEPSCPVLIARDLLTGAPNA